jgi:hypothetical protein
VERLSPQWVFVVQLREGMSLTPAQLMGWVEHLVCGQVMLCAAPAELVAFMTQVLTPRGRKPTATASSALALESAPALPAALWVYMGCFCLWPGRWARPAHGAPRTSSHVPRFAVSGPASDGRLEAREAPPAVRVS